MKIILLDSIEKLGDKGEVKEIKKGYFKNFLYPRNLAKIATPDEIARIEEEARKKQEQDSELVTKFEKQAEEVKNKTIEIGVRLIAGRKIFGSVKAKQIAELLGLKTKQIKITKPIKEAGEHKVLINLGKGVKTEILVNIVSKKKRSNKNQKSE